MKSMFRLNMVSFSPDGRVLIEDAELLALEADFNVVGIAGGEISALNGGCGNSSNSSCSNISCSGSSNSTACVNQSCSGSSNIGRCGRPVPK